MVSTILCLLILCFLVMAMSLGVLLWNLNKDNVGIVDADDVDPNADEVQIAREDQKNKDVINVLLVGSDSRDPNAELGRSDTMILASFNKAEGKATALSFLRDSLVEIDGHGQSKLGHTFLELLCLHGILWGYKSKHFRRESRERFKEQGLFPGGKSVSYLVVPCVVYADYISGNGFLYILPVVGHEHGRLGQFHFFSCSGKDNRHTSFKSP